MKTQGFVKDTEVLVRIVKDASDLLDGIAGAETSQSRAQADAQSSSEVDAYGWNERGVGRESQLQRESNANRARLHRNVTSDSDHPLGTVRKLCFPAIQRMSLWIKNRSVSTSKCTRSTSISAKITNRSATFRFPKQPSLGGLPAQLIRQLMRSRVHRREHRRDQPSIRALKSNRTILPLLSLPAATGISPKMHIEPIHGRVKRHIS